MCCRCHGDIPHLWLTFLHFDSGDSTACHVLRGSLLLFGRDRYCIRAPSLVYEKISILQVILEKKIAVR